MNTAHECENAVVYTHKLLAISFILAQAPTQTKTGCTLRDPLPPPPPPLPIGAPTPLPWLTQKGRSLSLRSLISTEGKLVSVRRDRRHWQLATPELEQIFDNLIALVLVLRLENVLALLANDGELERVWGDAGYQRGLAMYACIHVCVCVFVCVRACVRACAVCVREEVGARGGDPHTSASSSALIASVLQNGTLVTVPVGVPSSSVGWYEMPSASAKKWRGCHQTMVPRKGMRIPPSCQCGKGRVRRERGRRRLIGCRDGS